MRSKARGLDKKTELSISIEVWRIRPDSHNQFDQRAEHKLILFQTKTLREMSYNKRPAFFNPNLDSSVDDDDQPPVKKCKITQSDGEEDDEFNMFNTSEE